MHGKRLVAAAALLLMSLMLMHCGGTPTTSSKQNQPSMTGLWEMYFGGVVGVASLQQVEENVSGYIHVWPYGYVCFDNSTRLPISGKVQDNDQFELSIVTPAGHVRFTGTVSADHSSFSNAYHQVLAGCDAGNGGPVTGAIALPITGTFDFRLVSDTPGAAVKTFTATLTQSTAIGSYGELPVTGEASVAWPCYTGTVPVKTTPQELAMRMGGGALAGIFQAPGHWEANVYASRYDPRGATLTGRYFVQPQPGCPDADYGNVTVTKR